MFILLVVNDSPYLHAHKRNRHTTTTMNAVAYTEQSGRMGETRDKERAARIDKREQET